MPGGPIRVRIAPDFRSPVVVDPAVLAQLHHADVLDDPVLHVLQAGVVGVEHLARVHRVEHLVRALGPRHGDQPVEVGADHRALARLLAHALEAGRAPSRPARARPRACPASSIFVRYSSATDASSSPSSLRIDSICLRRKYSRCCLSAPDWTSSRIWRRTCISVRRSRWRFERPSPGARSRRASRAARPSARRRCRASSRSMSASAPGSVIERRKAAMRPSSPRSSRISSTTARYSRSRSRVLPSTGSSSGCGVTSTRRSPEGSVCAAPAIAAVQAGQGHGVAAAGQAHVLGHLGHGAHGGELVALARDQQHALLVAHVDGQRHGHVGEDDRVVHRYQQHGLHVLRSFAVTYLR